MSAERVAERIAALSGGRLQISVSAAGEVVPAFEVLDAVGGGVAEIGHTAAFFWQGKMPAANFFTTVPFGLTPNEHVAWVEAGGGQALWDDLYKPFGVKPFMGGNTGVCMGGWFRREIKSLDDVKGLKIRSLGLGGEVYRRLGATPQTTPAPTSRSASIASRRRTTARASTSRTAPASASCRCAPGTGSTPS
jgi:TRAP-type mannitol/chloroaromatic compound transport system substrate-binding protein